MDKAVPLEHKHIFMLEIQDEQNDKNWKSYDSKQLFDYCDGLMTYAVKARDGQKVAYTFMSKDKVIGLGGIAMVNLNVAEAWLLLGKDFKEHANWIVPIIKERIHSTDTTRIQCLCDEGFDRAERFLKKLGFIYEATLEKYGPGGINQKMYKIIKKEE